MLLLSVEEVDNDTVVVKWNISRDKQGWHDNNSQPIKAGFFGRLLLAFFKEILKKTAFYFFSSLSTTNVFKALDY